MPFAEMNNMCPDEAFERGAARERVPGFSFRDSIRRKAGKRSLVVFLPSEGGSSSDFHSSGAKNNPDRTPVFLRPSTI